MFLLLLFGVMMYVGVNTKNSEVQNKNRDNTREFGNCEWWQN